jgi:hypothetical protein
MTKIKATEVLKREATVNEKTWRRIDALIEILGHEGLIDAYIRAEEDQHCNDILDYIVQAHDLASEVPDYEGNLAESEED